MPVVTPREWCGGGLRRGGLRVARPLYKLDGHAPARRVPEGNAGLWFDKFCDSWCVDEDSWALRSDGDEDNPKLDWIRDVTERPVGCSSQLREFTLRLLRLIERRAGQAAVFVTESRFVTGLGRSHPVENGFAWHPTLGTPYLPGSSIKGLVRAWAMFDSDTPSVHETTTRLLGDRDHRTVGSLRFLDAVPVAPVQLEADVMTPHFAGWTPQEPPGDWLSPTPIPFLTTAAGTPFLFGMVPAHVADDDMRTASSWLREALLWAGAGAKTSVGYGRFRHDDEQTTRWKDRLRAEEQKRQEERERREAMRSPTGRWRLKLKGLSETEILDMVRVHLEKQPIEDPTERAAFAQAVNSSGLVDHWRRGSTRGARLGKKKLRERVRLLDAALAQRDA